MTTISSLGAGSGIDLAGLVEQLVSAEGQSASNRLDRREAVLQARLSAIGTVKGALSAFQSSVSTLAAPGNFTGRSINLSGPPGLFSATADDSAALSSYAIEVQSLAASHTLASAGGIFTDLSDAVGEGTLTIRFGETVYDPATDTYTSFTLNSEKPEFDVVIDSSNNTVQGLLDEINAADAGVTASVINDAGGLRLLLSSDETGVINSLELTVDEGGLPADNFDNTGLSRLAFNSAATNLIQTGTAADSVISINGLALSNDGNTLQNVIPGITLHLLKAQPGTVTGMSVIQDKETTRSNISAFVEGFNSLIATMRSLTNVDSEGNGSVLTGDAMLRNIENAVRRITSDAVPGMNGSLRSLGDIGISTGADGKFIIDNDRLESALENHGDELASLFTGEGVATRLDQLLESYLGSDKLLDSRAGIIGDQVGDIDDQREALALRLELLESRLTRQFSALDALVTSLNRTSTFLSQQLGILPGLSGTGNTSILT